MSKISREDESKIIDDMETAALIKKIKAQLILIAEYLTEFQVEEHDDVVYLGCINALDIIRQYEDIKKAR